MSIRTLSTRIDPSSPLLPKGDASLSAALDEQTKEASAKPDGVPTDRLELSAAFESLKLESLVDKVIAAQQSQPSETPLETITAPEGATIRMQPRKSLAVQAQEEAVQKALTGDVVTFKTLDGLELALRITPRDASKEALETHDFYRLTVGETPVDLKVAKGLNASENLAKLLEYWSKVPAHLRGALKAVELEVTVNPEDAYWAKVFGETSFASAATAGGGTITFWNLQENPYNLSEGTFNHEMGHLIGAGFSSSRTRHAEMVPPGWEEAIAADGNDVSSYGSHNPNEDFAEAWRYYLLATKDPERLREFEEKHPNRVKILRAVHDGSLGQPFALNLLDRDRMPDLKPGGASEKGVRLV